MGYTLAVQSGTISASFEAFLSLVQLTSKLHVFLNKKVVYKKVVLSCSKSYESSVLDFWDLRKLFCVYVFRIRFICVQNVMYVKLTALKQFNFCYLLRFIIISSVHGAFSLSTKCVCAKHTNSRIFQESLKKVWVLGYKELFYKKRRVCI